VAPTKKLEATAYHEAGHVVAAFLLHRGFRTVTIIPKEDSLGHMLKTAPPRNLHPDYQTDARAEIWLRREITICLAGPVAEKLHTGRGNWRIGGSSDFHHAVDWASDIMGDPDEIGAYLDWLTLVTKNMLKHPHHWPIVQALAAELLSRRTVGPRRARALMREAGYNAAKDWMDAQVGRCAAKGC
jgi:ATP-dependent Zn protease